MTGPSQPMNEKLFEANANACGTDKSRYHGYHRFYPLFLSQLDQNEPFTIVEIGYGNGDSLILWRKLFPKAFIVCLDRDMSESGDSYTVLKVDQSDTHALEDAMEAIPQPVRLIIDDGSHHPEHQLSTFSIFFKELLQPKGTYIIEDIETSYWLCGNLYGYTMRYGLFNRWSTIEALKLAADHLNRKFLSPEDRNLLEYSMMLTGLSPESTSLINMISFAQNCVIMNRSTDQDLAYAEQQYTYARFTARRGDLAPLEPGSGQQTYPEPPAQETGGEAQEST